MKDLIKLLLAKAGYRVSRLFPNLAVQDYIEEAFDVVLAAYQKRHKRFIFLQIGGFDGITFDPIFRYVKEFQWCGVICEPNPSAFHRLQYTYRDSPHVVLENVAVDSVCGTRALYFVRPGSANVPEWAYQLSSLNRDHLLSANVAVPDIEAIVEAVDVRCVTPHDLVDKHQLPYVDLLQVDAEGSDYDILKAVDFTRLRPAIVRYEHRHLLDRDRAAAISLLLDQGYQIVMGRFDTFGFIDDWLHHDRPVD